MNRVLGTVVIALALVLRPAPASATTIAYEVTNLTGDFWQYEYFPGDRVFLQDQGFVVFFDFTVYSDLALGSPLPVDWDPIVVQPDPALLSDGVYDALALVTNPSLAGPFRVSFRWLGLGTPPSQPFEIYELVNNDPVAIETGRTALAAAAVPEPSAALLMMICTVVGCALHRRRHPLRSCDP